MIRIPDIDVSRTGLSSGSAVALHSPQLSACSHITGPQLVCLRTVIEKGPLTATAISREVHVSASTVVGILDRLEDKGLIARERGRTDRRIVFVSATDAGRQLARDTPSPLQQKLAESLKLARQVTGRQNSISFTQGFHGASGGALTAARSGSTNWRSAPRPRARGSGL